MNKPEDIPGSMPVPSAELLRHLARAANGRPQLEESRAFLQQQIEYFEAQIANNRAWIANISAALQDVH